MQYIDISYKMETCFAVVGGCIRETIHFFLISNDLRETFRTIDKANTGLLVFRSETTVFVVTKSPLFADFIAASALNKLGLFNHACLP